MEFGVKGKKGGEEMGGQKEEPCSCRFLRWSKGLKEHPTDYGYLVLCPVGYGQSKASYSPTNTSRE